MSPALQPAQIDLCSPADKKDALIGIYLYDIVKDNNLQITGNIALDENTKQRPPMFVSLFFMVTSYIGAKSGIYNDHKLLERVLQIWHDNPVLKNILPLQPHLAPPIKVELMSPDVEQKNKIWHFSAEQQRLSLYYRVTPVPVVSTEEFEVSRVSDMEVR